MVFINETAVSVPPGTDMAAAVREFDAELAAALAAGRAYATDGVGREVPPSTPVTRGAIFRVVRSAARPSP